MNLAGLTAQLLELPAILGQDAVKTAGEVGTNHFQKAAAVFKAGSSCKIGIRDPLQIQQFQLFGGFFPAGMNPKIPEDHQPGNG